MEDSENEMRSFPTEVISQLKPSNSSESSEPSRASSVSVLVASATDSPRPVQIFVVLDARSESSSGALPETLIESATNEIPDTGAAAKKRKVEEMSREELLKYTKMLEELLAGEKKAKTRALKDREDCRELIESAHRSLVHVEATNKSQAQCMQDMKRYASFIVDGRAEEVTVAWHNHGMSKTAEELTPRTQAIFKAPLVTPERLERYSGPPVLRRTEAACPPLGANPVKKVNVPLQSTVDTSPSKSSRLTPGSKSIAMSQYLSASVAQSKAATTKPAKKKPSEGELKIKLCAQPFCKFVEKLDNCNVKAHLTDKHYHDFSVEYYEANRKQLANIEVVSKERFQELNAEWHAYKAVIRNKKKEGQLAIQNKQLEFESDEGHGAVGGN